MKEVYCQHCLGLLTCIVPMATSEENQNPNTKQTEFAFVCEVKP